MFQTTCVLKKIIFYFDILNNRQDGQSRPQQGRWCGGSKTSSEVFFSHLCSLRRNMKTKQQQQQHTLGAEMWRKDVQTGVIFFVIFRVWGVMQHVSLMPSWRGLELLYLVRWLHLLFYHVDVSGSPSYQQRCFKTASCGLFFFLFVFTGVTSLFAIQKGLQRKLPYPLQWNLLVSIGGK